MTKGRVLTSVAFYRRTKNLEKIYITQCSKYLLKQANEIKILHEK